MGVKWLQLLDPNIGRNKIFLTDSRWPVTTSCFSTSFLTLSVILGGGGGVGGGLCKYWLTSGLVVFRRYFMADACMGLTSPSAWDSEQEHEEPRSEAGLQLQLGGFSWT